jgi:pimeloyl-ACP methyl ester carboxylesterase
VLGLLLLVWGAPLHAASGKSKFADYRGMLVRYTDTGGNGPAAVFVHGWSCNVSFWEHQEKALSGGYRVLLMDMPGHGNSGKPRVDYTIPFFGGAVLAVMDHAGVDKAALMGHSMGFPVAREAWRMAPKRVVALGSIDGAMIELPDDPEARAKLIADIQGFAAQFAQPGYKQIVTDFVNAMHHEQTPAEVRARVLEEMLKTPQYVGQSAMKHFVDPSIWNKDKVEVPVLAVFADSPEITPEFQAFFRELFPKLTAHKMSGVGHFLMLEKPNELNAIIKDFLDGL